MNKFDEILKKSTDGSLSDDCLKWAIDQLQDPTIQVGDKLTILRAASNVEATQYTSDIELLLKYQSGFEDRMIARLALVVLFHWHTDGTYNSYILETMASKLGDDEEYDGLRETAIDLAGEWLRNHDNVDFMTWLFSLFEDEQEDPDIRECAYCAIGRAMGYNWLQLPRITENSTFDVKRDVDPLLLFQAKRRLENMQ